MFSRLMNLIKAMMNKGMSKLETPEVLAQQADDELESNLKKVKDGVVASLTNEKSLESQLKKAKDDIVNWDKRAAMAVQQNNDDIARQCLVKKQELNQTIATLTPQLEAQKQCTADLKAKHNELQEKVREFAVKKSNLMARGQASDAVTKANLLIGTSGGSGTAKWEQKIQEKEFKAEAMRETSGQPTADKFAALDQHIEVENELAALKQSVAPKLIVDTGSGSAPAKTVVDENVPMVIDENDDKGAKK